MPAQENRLMLPEWITLFALGVVYGTTVCSLSCLPILAPCLLSTGRGFKDGILLSLSFMQGKVLAYAFLGGLAAWLGSSFLTNIIPQPIIGMVLIAVGILLPFMGQKKCSTDCSRVNRRLPLFTLGMSTSLIPCPPLVAILVTAAQKGSISIGILYGALFGIGLMISPLLLAAGGAAAIGNTINMKSNSVRIFTQTVSTLLIISMGIRFILTA